ncbi:hypothetical protein P7C73_g5823, partial [Tremellales sp. Uapishka_1]
MQAAKTSLLEPASREDNSPISRYQNLALNDSTPRLFAIDESNLLKDHQDIKTVPAPGIVEFTQAELNDIVRQVPKMYHSDIDTFHPRQGIKILAPPRVYDAKVQLKPNTELKPSPLYDLRPTKVAALKDTLNRERMAGQIRPSNSPYGLSTFSVPRKDGRHRMVVDFCCLNAATVPDAYPLPLISEMTDQLSKSQIFTELDLVGAYQLLQIAEGYDHLTAFRTQFGMFESLVVRDGLRGAPTVFQHFLNETFADFLGKGVIVYIDDIIIHAPTVEEFRQITCRVLDRVQTTSLYLKASKCEFEKTSLKFLGSSSPATGSAQTLALPSLNLESKVTTELGDLLHAIVDVDKEQPAKDDIPATQSAVAKEEVPAAFEENNDNEVLEEVDRNVDDELILLDELLEGVRKDPALSHVRDELASSMTNPCHQCFLTPSLPAY